MINFIYSKLVSLDKPTNAGAYQQPKNYAFAALSVSEMAEKIGEGRAWRAGIYAEDTTNFKKTSVKGSFVLALDFDNNTHSPEEITDYAANIAFPANFYYYSYSQGIKPNNNFRVVWVLDEMITSNEYENIYPLLLGAFADYSPDRATKDASRLWYGTSKGVVVLREETIERSTLGAMTTAQGLKEGGDLRNIRKQKKTLGLDYADEPLPDPTYVNDGWWERLRGVCPQWDKWEQGIYMPHNERLVLMANLRFLRYSDTSKHVINDVLQFYNAATYAGHTCDERQIASWFRSNLAPQRIVRKFGLEFTVGEYLAMPESKVRLNATDRITIEELDAALDEQIPRILDRAGIDYIKSQTGGGKTERIIEWLTQQDLSQKKIIYAAPTYDLIDEFYARLKISEQK